MSQYTTANSTLPPAVLGVVGWSGSGKTTLLEFLLAHLAARDLRVNVIKHSHHDILLEPPHKDSARFRHAGASEVMVTSPYRYAIVRELHGEEEPGLQQQLLRLSPADLTLVEGFKWDPIPKLEVHRPSLGQSALFRQDPHIFAVASDAPAPVDAAPDLLWFDLNRPQLILDWLVQNLPGWQQRMQQHMQPGIEQGRRRDGTG